MSVLLQYIVNGQQRTVLLDAAISELHQGAAQVTEHPVEKGTNVADNIRPMPQRISIQGIITNTPIVKSLPSVYPGLSNFSGDEKSVTFDNGVSTGASTLQFDNKFDRVKDTYSDLVDAYKQGSLITIITSLRTYENFAIVSLTVPRSTENSNVLLFTVDLQEIITADVLIVNTPKPKFKKVSRSDKPTKEVKPEQQAVAKKSMAASLADVVRAR